jgi:hypothetical protein
MASSAVYNSNSNPNKGVLNSGFNQLYNQVFCKQLSPTGQFIKVPNSTLEGVTGNPNNKSQDESQCLAICSGDPNCTAYTFDSTLGSNTYNCTLFRNKFPTAINSNQAGKNSGYSLQFSYDYRTLNDAQKKNVRQKCVNQYLNNTFKKLNNVDLTSVLKFEPGTYNSVKINTDPSLLYDLYNKNGIKTNIDANQTYINIQDKPVLTARSDPIIDNYKQRYNTYMQNQAIAANVKNVISTANSDSTSLLQDLHNSSKNVTTQYIAGEQQNMDDISNFLLEQIGNDSAISSITLNEGFSNKISSESSEIVGFNYNIMLIGVILIIIIGIIITIIFNMKKTKNRK